MEVPLCCRVLYKAHPGTILRGGLIFYFFWNQKVTGSKSMSIFFFSFDRNVSLSFLSGNEGSVCTRMTRDLFLSMVVSTHFCAFVLVFFIIKKSL